MGLAHGIGQAAHLGIPEERIEGVVLFDVEVRHVAEQRGA